MVHYNEPCNICGLFMSYEDMRNGISWTPFGNSNDLEPPDEEFAHHECWEDADESRKRLICGLAWVKPNE